MIISLSTVADWSIRHRKNVKVSRKLLCLVKSLLLRESRKKWIDFYPFSTITSFKEISYSFKKTCLTCINDECNKWDGAGVNCGGAEFIIRCIMAWLLSRPAAISCSYKWKINPKLLERCKERVLVSMKGPNVLSRNSFLPNVRWLKGQILIRHWFGGGCRCCRSCWWRRRSARRATCETRQRAMSHRWASWSGSRQCEAGEVSQACRCLLARFWHGRHLRSKRYES